MAKVDQLTEQFNLINIVDSSKLFPQKLKKWH